MENHPRTYLTELLGTFTLVFVSAGAVCANYLFEQPRPGLIGVSIAAGIALAVGLVVTVPYGGGFLNPAITLMLWVYKRLDGRKTAGLIAVQFIGAALAGGLVRVAFMNNEIAVTSARLGTPHMDYRLWIGSGLPDARMILSGCATELCLTFILTIIIFATLIDPRAPRLMGAVGKWLSPLWVGLTLTALTLFALGLTGAAANPARWFGTVIWESTVPTLQTQHPFADHMVYWIGPTLGAILAGGIYTTLILTPDEEYVLIHGHAKPAMVPTPEKVKK